MWLYAIKSHSHVYLLMIYLIGLHVKRVCKQQYPSY